ncbi:MAG: fibronectin type III domain-containing protein [Planctomycetes bacterium]|nr:fibronectin type III domain-containing protein [Planctomycetota bacterium]
MIRINPSYRRFILSTLSALLLATLANTQTFAQLAPVQATDSDDVGNESSALASQVNAAFGLSASSLISLDLPDTPENGIELALPIDGEVVTVLAEPESILSPSYKLYIQVESGELIEEQPAPSRTLRGFVLEYPDSIVAGSLLETGFAGTLSLSDGRQFWIEPVASKIAVVDPSIHVVYRNDNIIPSNGTCSTNGVASNLNLGGGDGLPRGSACGTGLCFAELALDADFEFYTFWGSSTTSVQNRTQLVINTMNVEYERDVDITHVVTALVIRTSDAADPYTSTDPGTLVSQVRNHWNSVLPQIPRDITQLFSDKEIDGSVIGTAFNIGVVCTNQAYSYAQSDCCGSLGCATDLHAHENGHLWGGTHCDPCTTTMRSSITCTNVFSSSSINQITSHRDSRTCLATSGTYTPPFFDDFPTTTIDTTKWGIVSGAQINTLGNNEPSAPNSLNIDQSDSITTVPINLTVSNNATISYYWQRTGSADSPENGEDLFVEYLNNVNAWTLLAQHPGAGADTDPFQLASFPLPEDAKHPFFRLRFRGISTSTTGQDDFFIDNVFIDPGDITPPSPNPASFLVVPTPNPSNPQAELYMEATISTDPAGPVQYFFQRTNGTPTDSGWINTNVWIGPGPVPNSPWTFRVKTRDNTPTPNETTYSVPSAAYTAIESPGGVTSGNLAGDRFDATAQGTFTALNSLQSGLFFEVKNGQGDPVGTGSNEWTSNTTSTTRTITGLQPATQYTLRVKARNRAGVETAFTSSINVTTTDLIVPGAPILSNATDVSMVLTLNTNNNLPATEYAIQCSSSSPSDSNWINQYVNHGTGLPGPVEHWQTAGASITINNLLPGTQYTFHVKARNPSLQETPFGGTSSLTTGIINAPGASVLSNPAVDSMQLTISSNGNSAAVQYAIQCTGTQPTDLTWQNKFVIHATGAQSAAEDWQIAGAPITVTLLSPNVRYTFAVKARNASATFITPLGPDASLATLALPPGQPLVGFYPLTTAVLDVTPGNMPPLFNAGDTEFAIRCSSTNPPDASWTNQYVGSTGNAGASEVWRSDSTWGNAVLLDLDLETEYVFEVKARNRDGIETVFGPSIAFTTGSDCNVNNISDLREAAECTGSPSCSDCNENGLLDICEIGFDADQWAASVIDFSSQYEELPPSYLATQAVGAPNVTDYGDSPLAWSPADSDTGLEHVTVGFTAHVFASGAVVRESHQWLCRTAGCGKDR